MTAIYSVIGCILVTFAEVTRARSGDAAMGMGWERLFKNNPTPANDSRALAVRYESAEEAPSANSSPVITSLGALASGDQGRNGEAKSLKVARTFDSIDRRNEGLRTHPDGIELSFRDIEAIRSQFLRSLGSD